VPTLSVVIPAYNEERFIATLIDRIRQVDLAPLGFDRELIVVDDGSRDRTAEIVAQFHDVQLTRKPNGGKGSAVGAGIAAATGDYVMIQDADLEYDPRDYIPMLPAVVSGRSRVVYGSRYLKHPGRGVWRNLMTDTHPEQSLAAYVGGQSLSFVALVFTGRYLTDTVTAVETLSASAARRVGTPEPGLRARPRDHGEGAGPPLVDPRGADSLLPAHPRRRKKDRTQGLVPRDPHVLPVAERMTASLGATITIPR
jgi:glycosyltransferase involved in cell wall biosynthesis